MSTKKDLFVVEVKVRRRKLLSKAMPANLIVNHPFLLHPCARVYKKKYLFGIGYLVKADRLDLMLNLPVKNPKMLM